MTRAQHGYQDRATQRQRRSNSQANIESQHAHQVVRRKLVSQVVTAKSKITKHKRGYSDMEPSGIKKSKSQNYLRRVKLGKIHTNKGIMKDLKRRI